MPTVALDSDADTAYLPYSTTVQSIFAPVNNPTGVVDKSLHVVREIRPDQPKGSLLKAYNYPESEDLPAHLCWTGYPNTGTIIYERPIDLHLSGASGLPQGDSLMVYLAGFGLDTAWLMKAHFPRGPVDTLFAATGTDRTRDGRWKGLFHHVLTSDYDFDGHAEIFFYLNPLRDLAPRMLFCVHPDPFSIEWQVQIASPCFVDIFDCRDSLNPGVIFGSGATGHGATDTLFSDAHGYFIRVDRTGRIAAARQITDYPHYVSVLPGDSLNSYFVMYHSSPDTVPGEWKGTIIERVDGWGNTTALAHMDSATNGDGMWLGDYNADGRNELYANLRDNGVLVLTQDLKPVARFKAVMSGDVTVVPHFDGKNDAFAIDNDDGAALYDARLNRLALLPDAQAVAVMARGPAGEVTALAVIGENGAQWIVQLSPRAFWDYLSIFYRRHQFYVLAGMFALGVGLLLSLVFGQRLKAKNTELAEAHEALKQAQAVIVEQEKYKQAKDIAGAFAHEIRNALFPARFALNRLGKADPAQTVAAAEIPARVHDLNRAVTRAIDLTTLISRYTKLESEYNPEVCNLAETLASAVKDLSIPFCERGINVTTDGPADTAVVFGRIHLGLILTNLLRNSLDALAGRPDAAIDIRWSIADGAVLLKLADNGPGIPPEHRGRVFDAFYTTKPDTGTGLGLATVRRLVDMYNGTVTIEEAAPAAAASSCHCEAPTPEPETDLPMPTPALSGAKDKILVVDDDRFVLDALAELLSDDYDVIVATCGAEAVDLARQHPDIATVVMDIKMADIDGITAARRIRERLPDLPVIFHTGYPGDYDEDKLDETEKPFDYIQKGDAISRLTRSVRNAVEAYRFRTDRKALADFAEANFGLIGRSEPMLDIYLTIRKLLRSDSRVMILGETGTGKELVARALHFGSVRRERTFGILNCNHKAPDLVESELFGHVRGAFTGAVTDREGLFSYASGGTVFLDEVGDLDITTQAKLLRILETGEFQPVGSSSTARTEVRVLCATHRDLEKLRDEGKFREDLYYRLCGVTITMPPLRNRRDDIPLLVRRFIDRFTVERGCPPKVLEPEALSLLLAHDWPGNVRQLQHTLEAVLALAESDVITHEQIRAALRCEPSDAAEQTASLAERVHEFERRLIIETLAVAEYNIAEAARRLGMDRANLRRKMQGHQIDPTAYRD